MKQQFYECDHCGNMIAFVKDSGFSVICCDKEMHEVIPGAIDASTEKHIPAYSVKDGIVTVEVGSMLHPMTEEHHIEWISLQTKYGNQRKELRPEGEPCVNFAVCEGDEVEAVFAYCNLHGLWEAGGQKRRYSVNMKNVSEKHNEKAEPFSQALHFELYTTSTCPNCRLIKPVLEDAGIEFEVRDAEVYEADAKKLGLTQAPSLVAYGDEIVIYSGIGKIKEFIDSRNKASQLELLTNPDSGCASCRF